MRSLADLPTSGTVRHPSTSLSILDFNETEIKVSENVEGATVDATASLAHSASTGQVSGSGTGSILGISASGSDFSGRGDINGAFTFTAKPLKRGSIITLSGAKLVCNLTGDGSVDTVYGTYRFTLAAKPTFSFQSLAVNTSQEPMYLDGTLKAGKISVTASGSVEGTTVRRTVSVPYSNLPLDSMQIPSERLIGLSAEISSLAQSTKGAVQGYASRILDNQSPTNAGYAIRGSRSAKTGFSKLTFTGVGPLKGTSAVLNVDDSYELKTGKGFSNSVKAYGYSVVF